MKVSKAIVLAGGLGTRLKAHIPNCPKPMVSVDGMPFLEYLIFQLHRTGVAEILLSIGYMGDQIVEYFGNGSSFGVSIDYIEEKTPKGTGGALRLAEPLLTEDINFLLMNGDTFFDIDILKLEEFHSAKKALATLALLKKKAPQRYGSVVVNESNEIISFAEKVGTSADSLIYGGISIFNSEIFSYLPQKEEFSLERDFFPAIIGNRFYGLPFDDYFIDIGTPEDYLSAQEEFRRFK
ncbi:MAG: hypothetical protein A2W23_10165 [Planctomycetes bacterium RBG_16_43_13]|nr:MAG: hypothetical protein A2W23_10165 [Planctomycetes bacterium RBG_16_43_13]